MDDLQDGWDVIDADDEVYVRAPPSDDPACSLQVDAVPYRAIMQAWVEDLRAEDGLSARSADMYRRRHALVHWSIAWEFARRRKVGLEDDGLCRSVQAALDTQVIGSCAHCGCNFSVVAVWDTGHAGMGMVCGVCHRRLRVYNPVPVVRNLPANAEERWKGWRPW